MILEGYPYAWLVILFIAIVLFGKVGGGNLGWTTGTG